MSLHSAFVHNMFKTGFFLFLCLLQVSIANAGPAEIHDVRLWQAPDHTRIVFDLDGAVEHKLFPLSNPNRIVIDIPNATTAIDTSALDLKSSAILQVRTGQKDDNTLRIVLDLSADLKAQSFFLKAQGKLGDRLVVDLKPQGASTTTVTKSADDVDGDKRELVIAIDAGHGGEDPGAIGPKKVYEKQVVLAIAKELAAMFKKEKGYKPVLIRTGDYYVSLEKRRELAREAGADIFISIHADAFTSPQAHGSSVYALSNRGASSTTAQFLADKENKSDLIGGVSLDDKDPVLSSVLLDLSITHKMEASLDVGAEVLGFMGDISRLHSKHVEQAAFAVLKTPDIPSILVETGFISNPGEAKKLNTRAYQKQMARSIFKGVVAYFDRRAPEGTYVAWANQGKKRQTVHVVTSGDTLSAIALRYDVSMVDLSKHNGLSSTVLKIGQELKIPQS